MVKCVSTVIDAVLGADIGPSATDFTTRCQFCESHSWACSDTQNALCQLAAGKAAGKHGKDSGGKGHNMWRQNMRALWSNYEGADALPYSQWLAQLQHQATTRQADESNRLFAGQWSRALLNAMGCF